MNEGLAWQINRLDEMTWLDDTQNLIIIGPVDSGKTSLASHLGRKALEQGERVSYLTVSKLIEVLDRREKQNKYQTRYRNLVHTNTPPFLLLYQKRPLTTDDEIAALSDRRYTVSSSEQIRRFIDARFSSY